MIGQRPWRPLRRESVPLEVAKCSAYVLVAAPVLILLVLRSWSPVVATFFDSAEGMVALLVCTLCVIGGYCLMLYLGRMPGEERVLVR